VGIPARGVAVAGALGVHREHAGLGGGPPRMCIAVRRWIISMGSRWNSMGGGST
jgi:hypothetical protein